MSTADQRQRLWELTHERGMTRRRFLWLLSAGGAAAVLAACTGARVPAGDLSSAASSPPTSPWFKDPAPFIIHGTKGLESRPENMSGAITPHSSSSSGTTR